jgi:3-deoxy-manno-octulosonate cytidylyltransferase (CMP-KDO synthetase)
MTRADHQSGTERLAEVVEKCGLAMIPFVNVQGDEPMIPAVIIRQVAEIWRRRSVWRRLRPDSRAEEAFNPNAVKVVMDAEGYALYFPAPPSRGIAIVSKASKRWVIPSCVIWAFTAIAPALFAAMLTGSRARWSISKCWSSCACCGTARKFTLPSQKKSRHRRRHAEDLERVRAEMRFLWHSPDAIFGRSVVSFFPPLFFSSIDLIRVTSVCTTLIMKAVAFMRVI